MEGVACERAGPPLLVMVGLFGGGGHSLFGGGGAQPVCQKLHALLLGERHTLTCPLLYQIIQSNSVQSNSIQSNPIQSNPPI